MPRFLTEYDRAQAQGMLWTPTTLLPDVWCDFSVGMRDLSLNARPLTVVGSPTISTGLANGKPWRVFTQGTNYLEYTLDYNNSEYTTCWVLIRETAASNAFLTCYSTDSSVPNRIGWSGVRNSGSTVMLSQWFNDFDASIVPTFVSNVTPMCFTGTCSSTTGRVVKTNGGQRATQAGNTLISGGNSTCMIGGSAVGSSTGPFGLCEFISFRRALTDQETNLIEGYFSFSWGIPLPADHPYANRPPLIGD